VGESESPKGKWKEGSTKKKRGLTLGMMRRQQQKARPGSAKRRAAHEKGKNLVDCRGMGKVKKKVSRSAARNERETSARMEPGGMVKKSRC